MARGRRFFDRRRAEERGSGRRLAPDHFVLTFNTIVGDVSRQLTVTGTLLDGSPIDLTPRAAGTSYSSSHLTICNFSAASGRVFAGQSGRCTITVTNGSASATARGEIRTFTPTAVSRLDMPGSANAVAVNGGTAYVATGEAGLQIVHLGDRTSPEIVAALDTPGKRERRQGRRLARLRRRRPGRPAAGRRASR